MHVGLVASVTGLGLALFSGMFVGAAGTTGNASVLAHSAAEDLSPAKSGYSLSLSSADRGEPRPAVIPAIPRAQRMTLSVVSTTPASSGTYGVGVIPLIRFDKPVPEAARWAIQERLTVTVSPAMSEPLVWSWIDSSTVALRPKEFWPQKREVTITSTWPTRKPLIRVAPENWNKDKAVPPNKMIDIRMTEEISMSFRIGREQIFTIDAKRHTGVVTKAGTEVLRVPVSLGKSGWETASGVKTLMEFYEVKTLQNLTGPETWSVEAPYSIRLTWSGEFLHSATWNGSIGYANTSHGCTNLTLDDARWFYENGLRGDPVITKNTGMDYRGPWDGDGAPWNVGWNAWKAQSATAP